MKKFAQPAERYRKRVLLFMSENDFNLSRLAEASRVQKSTLSKFLRGKDILLSTWGQIEKAMRNLKNAA